jgi:carboxyl-terminal processing protease
MSRLAAAAAAVALAWNTFGLAQAPALPPQAVETFDAAWTIVRDTHFDKTFNGVNWDAVRTELRPRAAAAKSTTELRLVLRDMLGRLSQSHFTILPATADGSTDIASGNADPGFDVRLTADGLLITSVDPGGSAALAGVKPGWRVKAIGPAAVDDMLRRLPHEADDRFRRLDAWRAAEVRLRGPAGSGVVVAFEDEADRRVELTLQRRSAIGEPVTVGNLPTMFVRVSARREPTPAGAVAGVIAFNVWMAAVDAHFQKAMDDLRASDGIVIDLRGNPGGLAFMLTGISGHFLSERVLLGLMKTRDSELKFVANPRVVNARGERVPHYAGPLAILVDGLSGSASECFSGGMQSIKRARVFGETTMGQALPALFDRLPNGDVLIHAYGDFVTADGTRLEGRGVVPDEKVVPARGDLLAGRDPVLAAALAWVDRSKAGRIGVSDSQQP